MAGFVFGALGRAPEVGDEVRTDGAVLRVVEIEGSRIQRLEVDLPEPLAEIDPRRSRCCRSSDQSCSS